MATTKGEGEMNWGVIAGSIRGVALKAGAGFWSNIMVPLGPGAKMGRFVCGSVEGLGNTIV